MHPKTSLGIWRASFLAALGVYPVQLTACSSSDSPSNPGAGTGGSDASVSGTGGAHAATGGSKNAGGSAQAGGASGASGGANSGGANSGGASGSSGAGGASGGPADSGPPNTACKNPQPLKGPNGEPTGYVTCDGGVFHRTDKVECPTELPRTVQCGNGPVGDAAIAGGQCNSDADCTTGPNGYCQASTGPGGIQGCSCNYGCRKDSDCGPGAICGCSTPVGACVPANCTVDSDCGPGLLCLGTPDDFCGNVFACQTKADTCSGASDCTTCSGDAACIAQRCAFVAYQTEAGADGAVRGRHQCTPMRPCTTGRPFLVGGAARVADAATRGDWASSLAPRVDDLDAEARAALTLHYTNVALMEHASIAAFARFALELLSLGAPPELLVETHGAIADETVHARDAFALASAYAGRSIGPGALDVARAMSARGPHDIVETAILEGCIGETVAAVEAAEALAHATDPAVRTALERVVRDEAKHAELAWRFVRWALESGAHDLARITRAALLRVVSEEIRSAATAPAATAPERACLLAHGALGSSTRSELRRRVLEEIVEPCARALSNSQQQPAAQSKAVAAHA